MFARWRNLAAAAGAFCFPFSIVRASLPIDEIHCTRAITSANREETTEQSYFRTERESWYQRYNNYSLDDGSITESLPILSQSVTAPRKAPAVTMQAVEPIDPWNDSLTNPPSDHFEVPAVPAQALVNLNFDFDDMCDDDMDDDADTLATTPLEVPSSSKDDIEAEFYDVYAPYAAPECMIGLRVPARPIARLTGTIESLSVAAVDAWLEDTICGDQPMDEESAILSREIEPIRAPYIESDFFDSEGLDGLDDEDDTTGDFFESPAPAPKFHMFYPGCDWSPYYPASDTNDRTRSVLPEDVRSA
jgi:hypothetical protein